MLRYYILFYSLIISLFYNTNTIAQDLQYAKQIIDSLCSQKMEGRGYVNHGDSIAADFIINEFKKSNLIALSNDYRQRFNISVNTFPLNAELYINNKRLITGEDFIPEPSSAGINGKFKAIYLLADSLGKYITKIRKKTVVIDYRNLSNNQIKNIKAIEKEFDFDKSRLIIDIYPKKSASWHISQTVDANLTRIKVFSDSLNFNKSIININLDHKHYTNYTTANTIGLAKGKIQPDSFLVVCAHYDHLGKLGKNTIYPGANDNSSGIAMMLDIARQINSDKKPLKYSVLFIAFSAEEVGLLGSEFFCEQQALVPLKKIKMVLNLDMVGNGDKGITVVNGIPLADEFKKLISINDSLKLLPEIKARGEAANSDHYFFYKNKVKSFFIYTLGGSSEYHSTKDTPEQLNLKGYEGLFKLIYQYLYQIN